MITGCVDVLFVFISLLFSFLCSKDLTLGAVFASGKREFGEFSVYKPGKEDTEGG